MRGAVGTAAQCASPRPPSIIGSSAFTQGQHVLTSNGSSSSILYHSSVTPTVAGVSSDNVSASSAQQERVTCTERVLFYKYYNTNFVSEVSPVFSFLQCYTVICIGGRILLSDFIFLDFLLDLTSLQQQQAQAVGTRIQPSMAQGQQHQTVVNVAGARSVTSAANAQPSIIHTQQPQSQQAMTIQQGQFYGQQQQQKIVLQSPHGSATAQVVSAQQHCVVSQSE